MANSTQVSSKNQRVGWGHQVEAIFIILEKKRKQKFSINYLNLIFNK